MLFAEEKTCIQKSSVDGNVLMMWAMPVVRWIMVISVQGWNVDPAAPGIEVLFHAWPFPAQQGPAPGLRVPPCCWNTDQWWEEGL